MERIAGILGVPSRWSNGEGHVGIEALEQANDRGDRGNVGIIRSPIRASILPDLGGHSISAHANRFWVYYDAVHCDVR